MVSRQHRRAPGQTWWSVDAAVGPTPLPELPAELLRCSGAPCEGEALQKDPCGGGQASLLTLFEAVLFLLV